MFKTLVGWVIALPFAALVIALAVVNRGPVPLAWNPLDGAATAVATPLFIPIFVAFALGALTGGFVVWNRQRWYRRAAREGKREVKTLRAKIETLEAPPADTGRPALTAR